MANKRRLKKTILRVTFELLVECASVRHFQHAKEEDVDNVMLSILLLQDDLLARVSHPEPGMSPKAFYRRLREDLRRSMEELVDQLGNTF